MKNKWKKAAVGLFTMALILSTIPASDGKLGIFGGLAVMANAALPGSGTNISSCTVQTDGYTYTGNPITLIVTYMGKTLTQGTDFTVSGDITNAGMRNITITGKGDYNGIVAKFISISRAEPSYTVPTSLTATVGQTLADVELPPADNGTWSWADSTLSVGNAGTNNFDAVFTPKDTNNYNTVSGINVSLTVSESVKTVAETYLQISDTGNEEYGWCVDKKNNSVYLIYKIKASEKELKKYGYIAIFKGGAIVKPQGKDGKFTTVYNALKFNNDDSDVITGDNGQYILGFKIKETTESPDNFEIKAVPIFEQGDDVNDE